MINNQLFKNILLWLVIFVGIIALYQFVQTVAWFAGITLQSLITFVLPIRSKILLKLFE